MTEYEDLYESIIDDCKSWLNGQDYKFTVYILKNYIKKCYIHEELKYWYNRKKTTYNQVLYELIMSFNDNEFCDGGISKSDKYSKGINKYAIIGEIKLPIQYSVRTRRSRIGIHYLILANKYIGFTDFTWETMGFQQSNGFYECPDVLSTICYNESQ